jgi:tetratricopeptide (TPR) repeat protein
MSQIPVCLAAIVKDEEANLPGLIESLDGLATHFAIIDTGSTDGTKDLLTDLAHRRPNFEWGCQDFVNFGHNRTESLRAARELLDDTGDLDRGYIIVLDADERYSGIREVPKFDDVEIDMFYITRKINGVINRLPTILRARHPFYYTKAIHEQVACDCEDKHASVFLPDKKWWITGDTASSARGRTPDKFQRDIELLKAELEEDPNDPHAHFYLGQSYLGLGDRETALQHYLKRGTIKEGSPEHRWYATLVAGEICEVMGDAEEAEKLYLAAFQLDNQRAESLLNFSRLQTAQGRYDDAYLSARSATTALPNAEATCFIDPGIMLKAWEERMLCAAQIGRPGEAINIIENVLLVATNTTPEMRARWRQHLDRLRIQRREAAAAATRL